jgi:Family of unknown function (DUF5953)
MTSSLILHADAPALVADDRRPLAVVQAMERGMPGLRLAWTTTAEGFVPAPEGNARIIARTRDGGFALYCNGNNARLVTITGSQVPAALSPGGKPLLDVYAKWPMDATGLAAAADVLEGVAEEARSYWAHVTPDSVVVEFADQVIRTCPGPRTSPRGLPMLNPASDIRSSEIPLHLGWLNYWSAAAARAIGFPAPARDADLLARSRRTAAGGWVVRLTDVPLDLDNPAHLDALLRAYERFPEIGGRASKVGTVTGNHGGENCR